MTKIVAYLQKGTGAKKYKVTIHYPNGSRKTVQFGAKGYSDYTKHKDTERMNRYDARHRSRENWTSSGIDTAGFWAKWILWNKPTLQASINDTSRRFGITIIQGSPNTSSYSPTMRSRTYKRRLTRKSSSVRRSRKSRKTRKNRTVKNRTVKNRTVKRTNKSRSRKNSRIVKNRTRRRRSVRST